jgi:hypothetical protein
MKLIGFKRLGSVHLVFKARAGEALADPQYHDLSKWWIRPGDGDNFFI